MKFWRFNKYWSPFKLFSVQLPRGQAPGWSWWALFPIFDSSSRKFLPDFIHLSPYPEMEVTHTAGWHVVLAIWKRSITMRWCLIPASPSSYLGASLGQLLYHALPLYREQENHRIYHIKPVPHICLPALEKNSYRIAPCWGKKRKKGKDSFSSSLLTEVFWCCYCWFLKDLDFLRV